MPEDKHSIETAAPQPAPMQPSRPAIGQAVRRWRRTRELTLATVSERSRLNVGYLSQIENDKAVPSLDAVAAIASALEVPLAWLFLDTATPPRVVRANERPRFGPQGAAFASEVDGGTSRDLCIIEAEVPPGTSTGVHAHAGDEHHVIISGRWRMTQGEHSYELGPGDYIAWDPSIPHDAANIGDEPGRILVIYPRHRRRAAGPDAEG